MDTESPAFLAQDRGFISSRISTIFTALSLGVLILRIFTRAFLTRILSSDDYCMVIAWVLALCYTCCTWVEDYDGQNQHVEALSNADITRMGIALYFSLIFYQAALFCIKFSFICQYWRLFPTQGTLRCIKVLSVIVIAYGIYSVIANLFVCTPIAHFYDPRVAGYCVNKAALWYTNAAINIATDIAIFAIPLPSVLSLRIDARQKAGLIGIFGIGLFVCIVSIIRLHPLAAIVSTKDITWQDGPVAYWTAIEINTGIICGCLPTLRPLFVRFMPWTDTTSSSAEHEGHVEVRELDETGKLKDTCDGSSIKTKYTCDASSIMTDETYSPARSVSIV